jgi:hypothetical protein
MCIKFQLLNDHKHSQPHIIQNQDKCADTKKDDTSSRSRQQGAMMGPPTDYTVKNLKRQRRRNNSLHFFLNAELGLANSAPERLITVVTRAHHQIFKSSLLHHTLFIYDLFQYTINTKPRNRPIQCHRVNHQNSVCTTCFPLPIHMTQHAVSTYIPIIPAGQYKSLCF